LAELKITTLDAIWVLLGGDTGEIVEDNPTFELEIIGGKTGGGTGAGTGGGHLLGGVGYP
jgi:hypothetical protein